MSCFSWPLLEITYLFSFIATSHRKANLSLQLIRLPLRRRIPPRKLVTLSKRYFLDDTLQPLLAQSSSIALLKPPPSWALSPVAPSDEALRQCSLGEVKLSSPPQNQLSTEEETTNLVPQVDDKAGYIKLVSSEGARIQTVQAVIASGLGPDGDNEARLKKRRRKRKMQLMATVGVGVLAVAIAFMRTKGAAVQSNAAGREGRSQLFGDADECKARPTLDDVLITQSRDTNTGKLNINVHSEGAKQTFEIVLSRSTRMSGSPTFAKLSKQFAQAVLSQRKQFAQVMQNAVFPFMRNTARGLQAFLSKEANIFLMD